MDKIPHRTVPLRIIFGSLCSTLLLVHLRACGEQMHEGFIIAGMAMMMGYYYTSAWYEAAQIGAERKAEREQERD